MAQDKNKNITSFQPAWLISSATVAVKINGQQGLPLVSVSGVRQGCPLSPTLFGLLADGLHRFLQSAAAADGLALGPDLMVTDLGYADFCLVSATADGLQQIIDVVALWCDAVGMLPSSDKTVVIEMAGQQSLGGNWSCGGQALRQVSEVRYLGAIFSLAKAFCHQSINFIVCLGTYAQIHQTIYMFSAEWKTYHSWHSCKKSATLTGGLRVIRSDTESASLNRSAKANLATSYFGQSNMA